MFKQILAALALLVSPFAHAAGEISEFDVATYALIGKDGTRTDMLYRITKAKRGPTLEEKLGKTQWRSISCEKGCSYPSLMGRSFVMMVDSDGRFTVAENMTQ